MESHNAFMFCGDDHRREGQKRSLPLEGRDTQVRSGKRRGAISLGSAPSQETFRIGCPSSTSRGPAPARALPRAHPGVAAASYTASSTACHPQSQSPGRSLSGNRPEEGLQSLGGGRAMLQLPDQPWRPKQEAWRS